MSRAATVPGDQPAHPSGGYTVVQVPVPAPAPAPHPLNVADRIVTNSTVKLLGGIILSLAIAYNSLILSQIDTRLDKGDQHDTVQDVQLREFRDWKIAVQSQGNLYDQYSKTLETTQVQSQTLIEVLEQIRDRLPRLLRK